MSKHGSVIAFILAAAIFLAGCGGTGGRAGGDRAADAQRNANATSPAPAADGGANAATANAAASPSTNAASPPSQATGGDAPPPVETPGRPARAAAVAATPPPRIGSGGNDFYLFTKARGALVADAELKDANVIVEVKEGVGTLSGTVASHEQKLKAERLVLAAGFKSVKNQLKVSAGK